MRIPYLLSILIFVLWHNFALGQHERVSWNYDVSHGLPTNNLYHLLIDHSGKIWFGSDYGVTCYDGNKFKTYTIEDGLLDNTVIRCYEDSLNRIWFQHVSQPPTYFYRGQIHQLKQGAAGIDVKTGALFCETSKGNLTITAYKNGVAGYLHIFPNLTCTFFSIPDFNYGFTVLAKKDTIFLNNIKASESRKMTRKHQITFIVYGTQMVKILSQYGVDVSCITRSRFAIDVSDVSLIKKHDFDKIYHVALIKNKKYFATSNGIFCFKKKDGNWRFIAHYLPGKIIVSVGVDTEGNIWGTSLNSGLYFLPKLRFTKFDLNSDQRCVSTFQFGSRIYATGENLLVSELVNMQLKRLPFQSESDVLKANQYSPDFFTNGQLNIFGNSSFWRINTSKSSKVIKTKTSVPGYTNIYKNPDSKTNLYFYSFNGIGKLNLADSIPEIKLISNLLGRIKSVCETKDKLYIGTQKGIFFRQKTKIAPFYPEKFNNSRISGLLKRKGKLIIGTGDRGLWIYNLTTHKLINYNESLLSNIVKSIYNGANETFWLHSNIGLQQFKIENDQLFEIRRIDIKSKLKVNDLVNLHQINNKLILATNTSFYSIPLKQILPVAKSHFKVAGIVINNQLKKYQNTLRLSRNENNIVFQLSSVNRSTTPLSVLYRINKGKWMQNPTVEKVVFSSLSPGEYTVDFKAESPFYQTTYLLNYQFSIEPLWYENTILVVLGFVLSILFVALFVRWRITKTQERKRRSLSNELFSLQSQMNPHFTFNSLNSIQSYLSNNDKRSAQIYLADFAILMRKIMDQAKLNLIPLDEEIEFLTMYLNLEKRRLDNSFEYEILLDEKINKEESFMPTLMLQPFVENAIWHGVAPLEKGGKIIVQFSKKESNIICQITDNGAGLTQEKTRKPYHKSTGISNIRERMRLFEELFNKKIELDITDLNEDKSTGVRITLIVPKLTQANKLT